jgi:hypothetical protein
MRLFDENCLVKRESRPELFRSVTSQLCLALAILPCFFTPAKATTLLDPELEAAIRFNRRPFGFDR